MCIVYIRAFWNECCANIYTFTVIKNPLRMYHVEMEVTIKPTLFINYSFFCSFPSSSAHPNHSNAWIWSKCATVSQNVRMARMSAIAVSICFCWAVTLKVMGSINCSTLRGSGRRRMLKIVAYIISILFSDTSYDFLVYNHSFDCFSFACLHSIATSIDLCHPWIPVSSRHLHIAESGLRWLPGLY